MIQEKTLVLNGKNVHYLEEGKGDPVILIHGWAGSSDEFLTVISKLAEKFHVFAPDLPGCGLRGDKDWFSEELDGTHLLSAYIDFLQLFIKHKNLSNINLVGSSMGATIALQWASKYPNEILKVFAFEPTLGGKDITLFLRILGKLSSVKFLRKPIRWLCFQGTKRDASIKRLNKKDQESLRNEIYGGSLRALTESAKDICKGFDCRNYQKIKAKTLVIFGGIKTSFASTHTVNKLEKTIPHVKIEKIPQVGHAFQREDPKLFSKTIIEFLED